jgi:hypothetical protein
MRCAYSAYLATTCLAKCSYNNTGLQTRLPSFHARYESEQQPDGDVKIPSGRSGAAEGKLLLLLWPQSPVLNRNAGDLLSRVLHAPTIHRPTNHQNMQCAHHAAQQEAVIVFLRVPVRHVPDKQGTSHWTKFVSSNHLTV